MRLPSLTPDRRNVLLSLLSIGIATCLLYVPYLKNELIFDDGTLFSSLKVFDYSYTPFNLTPRTFPYFTLGFTEVIWHRIEAHRIFSLVLHLLNTFMVYRLCRVLLQHTEGVPQDRIGFLAWFGAAFFALHPVAVYGAAYLVQRTILFATLFSLLSLWFYARAFRLGRIVDCISAAMFYGLAVFSKEHAIMLPAVAIAMTPIFSTNIKANWKKSTLYLALCVPSSIWVVLAMKGIVGQPYEIHAELLTSEVPGIALLKTPLGRWLVSIITQMGLFFDYWQLWWLPDVHDMSVDIRVDFAARWTMLSTTLRLAGFCTCLPVAAYLICKGGRRRLFGFGLGYVYLLFFTEFAAMRFQEPFVLYRSYLWALGFIVMLIAFISLFNATMITITAMIALPLLFAGASDRLKSLSTVLSVWNDAAAKLPKESLPGDFRIFFNRARVYSKMGKLDLALADINRTVTATSNLPYGYVMRGIIYGQMARYTEALDDFKAAANKTKDENYLGYIELNRATVLEKLDRKREALAAYQRAAQNGSSIAKAILELKTKKEPAL